MAETSQERIVDPGRRAWRTAEDLHHTADRTRERADLVVDGTGRTPPGPPGEAP